jgi:hypothetical protein
VTSALVARPARADDDRAAAEALYEIAQNLMKEGKYAEACPKLEASNALDRGVGTLLLLGDCEEKAGKFASAWAAFQDASGLAKSRNDTERMGIANVRAAALRPRLTYVVFRVQPANDVPGFELRRSGHVIAKGSWGVSLPIDSGSYDLVATAPARAAWRTTIEVPVSSDQPLVVQVPALARESEGGSASAPAPSTARPPPSSVPAPEPDRPGSTGKTQRTLGITVAVVGVAAAATAGVLAYLANQKNKESMNNCEDGRENFCNPQGVSARRSAQNLAQIATFFDIGAGVAIASGAVLYFTAPSDEHGKTTGLTVSLHARF